MTDATRPKQPASGPPAQPGFSLLWPAAHTPTSGHAPLDPNSAQTMLPNNVRRIIRALEVIEATGEKMSVQQTRHPPPFAVTQIGLQLPRPLLYERVDLRVDKMLENGLVNEVRGLVARGYAFDLPSMTGLGYREFGAYVRGEIDLDEAVRLLKSNTRKFIRHQANWFRPTDARIHWFDLSVQTYADVQMLVQEILRR